MLTLAVELPVALCLLLALRWTERVDVGRAAAVIAAATLLTHPVAWWASVVGLHGWVWSDKAMIIESAVVVAETGVLAGALPMRIWRAWVVAAVMNLASFGVGVALG